MKTLKFKWLSIIIALLAVIPGCKKDGKEVSKFVGSFVISKALVAEAFTVPTQEAGDMSIPVNTDITSAIQSALLSAVSCSSPDKSYVELREDNSMYLSCEGSSPLNAGTWEEISTTSLKLNMNSSAIPPSGFVLSVTDIVDITGGLAGKATIPLPKAMIAAMLEAMQLHLSASAPEMFIIKISIEFDRK